ncbi:alpha-galactosidase [[Clostridium] polysaccharolyticum]|uniref:Alpha-galactosidase n=1 Tax=[Clostridium] polysaccharolyticum TaxID=29364 RepID=A0A1I0CHQ2_9FIRM|nr:alpha-galactosidase [[Clostridium] polysaccharolyticum]SET18941.1 alpha-galactosidase [[Clostridium] polysaccharolyticum]
MAIIYTESTKEFHLYNQQISYLLKVLPNGQIGNLYYGKHIRHKEDYSYLLEGGHRPLAVYTKEKDYFFSPQYTRMEYPSIGTGDFREPAFLVTKENGSTMLSLEYQSHRIYQGKEKLNGLPALYVEAEQEAESLEITLQDTMSKFTCILKYSIYKDYPVLTRSVEFVNQGKEKVWLERVLSASVDLPDDQYEMVQLSGAWARERKVVTRPLAMGIQGITSRRGISSAEQNPFIAVKRKNADEMQGEVYGFSLVYSGNHLEQIEVDTCNMSRIQLGIHPDGFCWPLLPEEAFQSPEAVLVYSDKGLNGMSQAYHKIYRQRLVRGVWRDKERPILINNWEATGAAFTDKQILEIAKAGKELGMELFVLDDGWFGKRDNDESGLGDWYVTNYEKLPEGIEGIANKITSLGMKFGLWFEPEMVNKDSDLYREHPDWILCEPDHIPYPSRNQYILDFSRKEVTDYIYELMENVLSSAPISYVKWDMNRYMTDSYSVTRRPEEQGKIMHEYILGVYGLYERLIRRFPEILFESCSSGGARFDPGMLYYAPQAWTSDDTDAMERVKIQYGTSFVYPLSSMGAHVSEVPNQQVGRVTTMETRGNVALFGMFGFELDLGKLTESERELVKEQVAFAKAHRKLIMTGTFYRLQSPFEGNDSAWMIVSEDKKEALVGFYRMSGVPNAPWTRLRLAGLDENRKYQKDGDAAWYGGDELMHAGMVIEKDSLSNHGGDYSSGVVYLYSDLMIDRNNIKL